MPNPQALMKLLFSSADLGEVGQLVKRLVWSCIPCAVCRDPANACLSVWIQQDADYPLALRIFTQRKGPRPLPRWAWVFDPDLPAKKGSALAVGKGTEKGSSGTSPSVRRTGWVWENPGPQPYKNEGRILLPTRKTEASAPLSWLMLPSLPPGQSTGRQESLPEVTPPQARRAEADDIGAGAPMEFDAGIPDPMLPK